MLPNGIYDADRDEYRVARGDRRSIGSQQKGSAIDSEPQKTRGVGLARTRVVPDLDFSLHAVDDPHLHHRLRERGCVAIQAQELWLRCSHRACCEWPRARSDRSGRIRTGAKGKCQCWRARSEKSLAREEGEGKHQALPEACAECVRPTRHQMIGGETTRASAGIATTAPPRRAAAQRRKPLQQREKGRAHRGRAEIICNVLDHAASLRYTRRVSRPTAPSAGTVSMCWAAR